MQKITSRNKDLFFAKIRSSNLISNLIERLILLKSHLLHARTII